MLQSARSSEAASTKVVQLTGERSIYRTGQLPVIQERVKWKLPHAFLYKMVRILHCPRLAPRLRQGCWVTAFVELRKIPFLRSCYFVHFTTHSPDNKSPLRLTACTVHTGATHIVWVDSIQWTRPMSCCRYRIVIALPSSRKLCRVWGRPLLSGMWSQG